MIDDEPSCYFLFVLRLKVFQPYPGSHELDHLAAESIEGRSAKAFQILTDIWLSSGAVRAQVLIYSFVRYLHVIL